MGDVALTIHLTREEYERLLQIAARQGRPVEDLGADAVRHLLPPTGGIATAFTGDEHFRQMGLVTVPAEAHPEQRGASA
jgi:hypothetical protein